jgi:hypothetical protein
MSEGKPDGAGLGGRLSTSTKSVLNIGKYQAATKPNNREYSQKRGVARSDQELGSVAMSRPVFHLKNNRPFEPLRGVSGKFIVRSGALASFLNVGNVLYVGAVPSDQGTRSLHSHQVSE